MSSAERDLQRKMRRTLQLTIQTDHGLFEGDVWWLDTSEVTFWCAEELMEGQAHALRVHMGPRQPPVDIKARISETHDRHEVNIPHGSLHVAVYETIRKQDRKTLDALLTEINPEFTGEVSRDASSSSVGVSTANRASKARRRIAENRARRRKAAEHMPQLGDRLHPGQVPEADLPPLEVFSKGDVESTPSSALDSTSESEDLFESAPPLESRPPSDSGLEFDSDVSSESDSESDDYSWTIGDEDLPEEEFEADPVVPAEEPVRNIPDPPQEDSDPGHVFTRHDPKPPPSRSAPKDTKPAKKSRPSESLDRDEREARHRARMASLQKNTGGEKTRSRRSKKEIREERIARKRAEHQARKAVSPPPQRPSPPPAETPESPGTNRVPAHAMVSPGDPPSVFVRFTDADQVRGALHGDPPQPRCLIQGVSGLFPGTRIEAAFQLPSSIVVQVDARVLAIDGDQAMLQLSSDNPADIASLLQARG